MDNIVLNTGKYLNRDYGKYAPNLTYITNTKIDNYTDFWDTDKDINIADILNLRFDGTVKMIMGSYRKNDKGTNIFDITGKITHYLIRVDWGGSFNDTRGDIIPNIDNILSYVRIAKSNGGGTGYSYYIIDIDYKCSPDVNDF